MKQVIRIVINIHIYLLASHVICYQNVYAQSTVDKDAELTDGMLSELSELANFRDILAENSESTGLTGSYEDEVPRNLGNILGNDDIYGMEDALREEDKFSPDKRARFSFYGARGKKFSPSSFFGARGKRLSQYASGFFGSRGKRMSASAFFGSRGKRPRSYALQDDSSIDDTLDFPYKRYSQSAFFGSRGKRAHSAMSSFLGVRGKKAWPYWNNDEKVEKTRGKKFASTFFGARGKKSSSIDNYLDNNSNHIDSLLDTLNELNTLKGYRENDDKLNLRRKRHTTQDLNGRAV